MDWDILIPILMFFFPLLAALLDKRAKRRKEVPPVNARPIFPPAENQTVAGGPLENRSHPRLRKREGPAAEGSGRGPAQPDVFRGFPRDRFPQEEKPTQINNTEGQRAIVREKQVEVQDDKPKLEIDKKKLILYSEILKPKFDA